MRLTKVFESRASKLVFSLALCGAGLSQNYAAFTYQGCADVVATDFTNESLVSNATDGSMIEPMKMAFDMDVQGKVTVYFTQRLGQLRKYDPLLKKAVDIHDFASYPNFPKGFSSNSDGLLGIALDPAFKTNGWIYLYLSLMTEYRVSRFTLAGGALDRATEKVLITIPQSSSVHPGGALQMDKHGDLWITTGENNKGWPAANSMDGRGKILRIHPMPDGSYTIPEGNLFKGVPKTMPEIYIMGNRNPYTLTLDTVRNAITWGDVGPDAGQLTEEHGFASKPGFHGYPFWSGNQIAGDRAAGMGTPEKPTNKDASNTGIVDLPPAIPSLNSYKQSCSITGPVYYYNAANPSTVKMPPHFNGIWFIGDFSNGKMEALNLDGPGNAIVSRQPVFANMKFDRPLDFQVGPDGAFYVVNYSGYRSFSGTTALIKIGYKGPPCVVAVSLGKRPEWVDRSMRMDGSILALTTNGRHSVEVKDLSGRNLGFFQGSGAARYDMARVDNHGVAVVTVTTEAGRFSWKLAHP
jgi:cytochrome c